MVGSRSISKVMQFTAQQRQKFWGIDVAINGRRRLGEIPTSESALRVRIDSEIDSLRKKKKKKG